MRPGESEQKIGGKHDLTYPQKINVSENIRLAILPAVSAASILAATIVANVP
jgi:hypothetical protein